MIIQVCNVYILENTLQIHGGIWKIQVCNVYNLESTLPNFETCGGVDVRRLISLWVVTVFSLIGCERVMHIIGALIGPYVGPYKAHIWGPYRAPISNMATFKVGGEYRAPKAPIRALTMAPIGAPIGAPLWTPIGAL